MGVANDGAMPSPPSASPLDALRRAAGAEDSVEIPAGALWGARTAQALRRFAIGGPALPRELIHAIVRIKAAAAAVNTRLGRLDEPRARAVQAAALELLSGAHDAQFPLSPWQSGAGLQSQANVGEVLARLAERHLGEGRRVDPDEIDRGQSPHEVLPSAIHLALRLGLRDRLLPALDTLEGALATQATLHDDVVKLGRRSLLDDAPLTLGAEIGAWRTQLLAARGTLEHTLPALGALAFGGTGEAPDAPDVRFAEELCRELSARTGLVFVPAPDRAAALAGHEAVVACHGALKTLAVALAKLAEDLRLLAAFGELTLPVEGSGAAGPADAAQCEALLMVCWQVMANDLAVTLGAAGSRLQANSARPLLAFNALGSVGLLAEACAGFEAHAVRGLSANRPRIAELLSRARPDPE